MLAKARKVYLAGKVFGVKQRVASKVRTSKLEFVCSDGSDHSEHGWGSAIWDYSNKSLGSFVQTEFVDVIKQCECLVAILDRGDSYGSIAEIAYASAIGIPSILLIWEDTQREKKLIPSSGGEFDDGYIYEPRHSMVDSYWFISNFPQVYTIMVKDEDDAALALEAVTLTESPMEFLFWAAVRSTVPELCKYLCPQVEIPTDAFNYRIDFLFEQHGRKIAIEIDGHDAHKTREQRTHDAQKDRFMKSRGIETLRFTGTELHRDAVACAKEFFRMALPEIALLTEG